MTTRGISLADLNPDDAERVRAMHLARCGPGSPLLAARTPRRNEEHSMQAALFAWIFANEERMPALRLAYGVPNFAHRVKSERENARNGARLNAEGRRKGMLDVVWPIARDGFHSLYLELKTPDGSLSKEQRWWRSALRDAGHCVYVPRSWESARDFMLAYESGSYLYLPDR